MSSGKKATPLGLLSLAILVGSALPLFAQGSADPGGGEGAGAPGAAVPGAGTVPSAFRYLDFKPAPKTYGVKADALLGFRFFEGVDTALWARGEAAYKTADYYRASDLSLYRQDLYPGIPYTRTALGKDILLWGLGVQQGLHFNPTTDRDDMTLLLSWRGYWTDPAPGNASDSLLPSGSDPYKGTILIQSFQLDLLYDGTRTDSGTKVPAGWWFDLSAEYGPPGMSAPAAVDYAQFDASARGFLPLYARTDARGWNILSLYLAGSGSVDYIAALGSDATKGVPYPVSQRFGGRVYQEGLGGAVRGLGDGWADGAFKAAANLELRCNLPALVRPDVLAGVLVFVDGGYYADPPGASSASPLSSGAVATSGLGAYIDLFDKGYIAVYSSFILNTTNFRNENWEPISFEFGLHF